MRCDEHKTGAIVVLPHMDICGVYAEVVVRRMERIRPLILGDGSHTLDFIYVDDVASHTAGGRVDRHDEVFNVASKIETSLLELAQALLWVMGSSLEAEFGPERKVNLVPRRLAETTTAKERLGLDASVGLDVALERLVQWWAAQLVVAI